MASVFLSYDHDDGELAKPLVQVLEKAGHTVWFDRHIHGGAQYSRKIEQALDEADAVVVLWSPRSLESAWVRDEAAEGRDRGKLVPLSVDGVTPPMGFRQFQTIDLGPWKGRGKVPKAAELLNAVNSQAAIATPDEQGPAASLSSVPVTKISRSRWLVPIAALMLLSLLAVGAWNWLSRGQLPVIEVAAANASPRSQAAASDLFVKLGSLAAVGEGKWKLVDASAAPARPDLVFRTADTGSAKQPQANLVLLDGKDDALLWSREFRFPAGGEADLRQQMAWTAGRVLGCALESREAGGLSRSKFKLFLSACAQIGEASIDEPDKVVRSLRAIVAEKPGFTPAWGRLLFADLGMLDVSINSGASHARAVRELKADMERARKVAPDLPELTLVEAKLLPATAFGQRLDLLARGVERAPDNVQLLAEQTVTLQRVGRMSDAVVAARQAAELDPLSPATTTHLIMTLAYAGQLESAREQLARAEKLWAGTDALRDALWGFHLRFGDPQIARKYAGFEDAGLDLYLAARANPTQANRDKFAARIRALERHPEAAALTGWVIQGLGEIGEVDAVLAWLSRTPTNLVADNAYVLFRPGLASLRRDPRFMTVAKRIGLIDYWRSSGTWPDFCSDSALPYDCKAEAAKYG